MSNFNFSILKFKFCLSRGFNCIKSLSATGKDILQEWIKYELKYKYLSTNKKKSLNEIIDNLRDEKGENILITKIIPHLLTAKVIHSYGHVNFNYPKNNSRLNTEIN